MSQQDPEVELDAPTRAFLAAAQAAPGDALEAMPVPQARESLKALMLSLDIARCEVAQAAETTIPGPDGSIPLRTYQPPATADLLPVVVFFHGGGWALGDLESYDNFCRFLCARSGAAIVSVGYRLAPEHPFPAGLEDCYTALQWTGTHASALGADPSRLCVAGDSAGGNLAAVLALRSRSKGVPVQRQILLYPLLSLLEDPPHASRRRFGNGEFFISRASIAWSIGLYLSAPEQALLPEASPILEEDLHGAPTALIVTAGCDPLRDEGQLYAKRLTQANVAVDQRCFPGTIHAFMSFGAALASGRDALAFVADWIRTKP